MFSELSFIQNTDMRIDHYGIAKWHIGSDNLRIIGYNRAVIGIFGILFPDIVGHTRIEDIIDTLIQK